MTNIEFRTHIADKIHYTCRWVRKALANSSDCRVVIYATDRNLLNRLDDTLWTFSDSDFLPHAVLGDRHAARCPVILTSSDTDELPHSQILLNLSPDIPAFYAQFERLLELVSTDPADTEAGAMP